MRLLRKIWRWLDDRGGFRDALDELLTHPVPPGIGWLYVLGSATVVSLLLQIVTGIALSTLYVPSAGQAYESLEYITHQAFLGSFLRGVHYINASVMVVLMVAHLIRVFLTGSYKFPRELNWLSGVVLLGVTAAMGFTGQILRWDQDAVWGIVVAAEQAARAPFIGGFLARFVLAGEQVGAATLSHLFTYHVFLLPALLLGVLGLHLYLVIRNGVSEPPVRGKVVDRDSYREEYQNLLRREGKPFFPHAAWRDMAFATLVVIIVLGLAGVVGPKPLGEPPDPSSLTAVPRPDWYFLWYFAVLALLPHGTEKYLIWILPTLAGIVLVSIPLLFPRGERHPLRRPWAWISVVTLLVGIGVLTRLGIQSPWSPDFAAEPLPPEVVGSSDPFITRGADLFHERGCQYCHSISGNGGIRGPDLTFIGDELPPNEIKEWIANGGKNMPSFAEILDTREMDALAAFLSSRQAGPGGDSP